MSAPEQQKTDEQPLAYVQRLAADKAQAGASLVADCPVLGADTIVVLEDRVLEKPCDKKDAVSMLLSLSERIHEVITAVALCFQGNIQVRLCVQIKLACSVGVSPTKREVGVL